MSPNRPIPHLRLPARPPLVVLTLLAVMLVPVAAFAQGPAPLPSFDLLSVLKLIAGHQWLPLAMVGVLYARTLVSDKSKFPWTIPPAWLHVLTAFLTLVFGVLVSREAGAAWQTSILGGVVAGGATGFFDGFAVAVFGDASKAPAWARFILAIADDATKGGGGTATPYRTSAAPPPSGKAPPPAARRVLSFAFAGAILVACLAGCPAFFGAAPPVLDCGAAVAQDALKGMSLAAIYDDVKGECGNDLGQVIAALLTASRSNPQIAHTKAYNEGLRARAELLGMPDPVPAGQ